METTLWTQVEFFIWSTAAGAIVAFVYDLFRIGRRMIKTRDIVTNIQDIIFLVISALIIFGTAYQINSGEIRWYELFGIGIGFFLYRLIVGDTVVKASVKIISFLITIFLWIIKIILTPIAFFYKLIRRPFNFIVWYTKRGAQKASSVAKIRKERFVRHLKTSKKAATKK